MARHCLFHIGVALTTAVAPCCLTFAQNNPPATPQGSGTNPIPSSSQAVGPDQQQPGGRQAGGQDAGIQEEAGADQGRFVFKKDVQEVVLHATVVDETGHLVTNLERSAFSVFQNGVAEPITSFRREDVPVAWELSSTIPAPCGINGIK